MDRKLLDVFRVLEAALYLALASILVLWIPYPTLVALLRRPPRRFRPVDVSSCLDVGLTVARAAKYVPWKAVCFPQAIATKLMLARRGYISELHLGVRRIESGALVGHAWLKVDSQTIVGADGVEEFTPLVKIT